MRSLRQGITNRPFRLALRSENAPISPIILGCATRRVARDRTLVWKSTLGKLVALVELVTVINPGITNGRLRRQGRECWYRRLRLSRRVSFRGKYEQFWSYVQIYFRKQTSIPGLMTKTIQSHTKKKENRHDTRIHIRTIIYLPSTEVYLGHYYIHPTYSYDLRSPRLACNMGGDSRRLNLIINAQKSCAYQRRTPCFMRVCMRFPDGDQFPLFTEYLTLNYISAISI